MGTTFTHFNPLCDEHGHTLQERFKHQIKPDKSNVYCIYIREDAQHQCYKLKLKESLTESSYLMSQTPLHLFQYIFGDVLSNYIDDPAYKNITEKELFQVASDFLQHLQHTFTHESTMDFEQERFHRQFPNNMFAKHADHSKRYFYRTIHPDTKQTFYYHFPIMIRETTEQYHVIIQYIPMAEINLSSIQVDDALHKTETT